MIAARDILIFASLAFIAAAFIATFLPAQEGVSPVPHCSDCKFKLTGPYVVVQREGYAALVLGGREVAKYGWAYYEGRPLVPGDVMGCNPMYVLVAAGSLYFSCRGEEGLAFKRGANITYSPKPKYLKLEVSFKMGYPRDGRNNIHVRWIGSGRDYYVGNSPSSATLWIDMVASALLQGEPQGVSCEPASPSASKFQKMIYCGADLKCERDYKPSDAKISRHEVSVSGNKVAVDIDGFLYDLGATIVVEDFAVAVYQGDVWRRDWGEGFEVKLYVCK